MGTVVLHIHSPHALQVGVGVRLLSQGVAPICMPQLLCKPFSDTVVSEHWAATDIAKAFMDSVVIQYNLTAGTSLIATAALLRHLWWIMRARRWHE